MTYLLLDINPHIKFPFWQVSDFVCSNSFHLHVLFKMTGSHIFSRLTAHKSRVGVY